MATTKIPVELSSTPGIVDNSNATAITIDSSEKVGIGTTNPEFALHAIPSGGTNVVARFESNDNQVWIDLHDDGSGAYGALLGHDSDAGNLFMVADASVSTKFIIKDGGNAYFSNNVGIGTSSPSSNLHVVGSNGTVRIDNASSTKSFSLTVMDSNNRFRIMDNTSSSERLTITNGGNVGIGTTSPSAFLHVSKDNDNAGNQFAVADIEGVSPAVRTYTHNGDPAALILNHYYAVGGSSNEYMRYADFVANVGNGAGTTMRFITKNAANTFSVGLAQDNNGNVGIGTTAPAQKLHVNSASNNINTRFESTDTEVRLQLKDSTGTAYIAARNDLRFGNDTSTERMRIQSNGRLGLGTTSANGLLHIGDSNAEGSSANPALQIGGANTYRLGFYTDSEGGIIQNLNGDNGLQFRVKTAGEVMRIMPSGKVGIGTTSPSESLEVNLGDIKVQGGANASTRGLIIAHTGQTGNLTMLRQDSTSSRGILETTERNLRISAGSGGGTGTAETLDFYVNGSERMMIDTSGRVGIGTSSPHSSAKVHSYTGTTNGQAFHAQGLGSNNFKIVPYCSNGAFSSLTSEDDVCLVAENAGAIVLAHHASGYFGMRIQSNGHINIGTKTEANGSTGGCSFSADSSNRRNFICATTGSGNLELIEFRNPNGTVGTIKSNGSSTSYNTSSDYRLKENVTYTWDATSRLKQLKPARFNFKADADVTLDGFLAHEVSSVVPQAVSGEKDGEKMQELDHSKLVPLLVKTIQELEARIKVLEDK